MNDTPLNNYLTRPVMAETVQWVAIYTVVIAWSVFFESTPAIFITSLGMGFVAREQAVRFSKMKQLYIKIEMEKRHDGSSDN